MSNQDQIYIYFRGLMHKIHVRGSAPTTEAAVSAWAPASWLRLEVCLV